MRLNEEETVSKLIAQTDLPVEKQPKHFDLCPWNTLTGFLQNSMSHSHIGRLVPTYTVATLDG